jgi:hypothetical protein
MELVAVVPAEVGVAVDVAVECGVAEAMGPDATTVGVEPALPIVAPPPLHAAKAGSTNMVDTNAVRRATIENIQSFTA